MNYRHAYHAGNFADVMKHVALMMVVRHLSLKEKPFRVIDTHAGRGWYRVDRGEAARTGEWANGFQRLVAALGNDRGAARSVPSAVRRVLDDYLATVATAIRRVGPLDDDGAALSIGTAYPGSPLIARALMRPQDQLHVNELHAADAAALTALFHRDGQTVVTTRDGWQIAKSALPAPERRGVVLIDPPFELPGEFDRLIRALADGLQRFATGTYLLWYPIKDRVAVKRFYNELSSLADAKVRPRAILACELSLGGLDQGGKLAATGLVVCNPPYRFAETYSDVLDVLARRLASATDAAACVQTLVAET